MTPSTSVDLSSLGIALGIGLGLASVAGLRAFVPLLLVALGAKIGLLASMGIPESFLGWPLIGALAALAVAEGVVDKVRRLERVFNLMMIPVRAAAGAILLVAALGFFGLWPPLWLGIGAVVSGGIAVLKFVLRPRASRGGAGVSTTFLSLFEDVVALVGGIVGLFVPILPLVFVAFLLFFFHRVRRRRGRKYEGLRILRD
jgi:small basic protein